MEELILKSSLGSAGFFASLGLQNINQLMSFFVGAATLVFLALSIYKILEELKKK